MSVKTENIINEKEIIERGSTALIKELGYSGFLKYILKIQTCDKITQKLKIEE